MDESKETHGGKHNRWWTFMCTCFRCPPLCLFSSSLCVFTQFFFLSKNKCEALTRIPSWMLLFRRVCFILLFHLRLSCELFQDDLLPVTQQREGARKPQIIPSHADALWKCARLTGARPNAHGRRQKDCNKKDISWTRMWWWQHFLLRIQIIWDLWYGSVIAAILEKKSGLTITLWGDTFTKWHGSFTKYVVTLWNNKRFFNIPTWSFTLTALS